MEIKLYDGDLAAPTFIEDLTNRVEGLSFSTILHGGFNICKFGISANLFEAWDWITKRSFYRLVINDAVKILWEGRVEDIAIVQGEYEVTSYGYYANLTDIPYRTAYNQSASSTIKDMLTANCSQISADQSHIVSTDIIIDSSAGPDYLDKYPNELVEKLLKFSDSTYAKWYFAIWDDRIPYLFKRATASIDWLVSIKDFQVFKLAHRGGDLWNRCYAVYDAPLNRTGSSNDTDSQAKYGIIRELVIDDLGDVAAAAAQAQRDAALENAKDIWPKLDNMVLGDTVYTPNGLKYSSSWVRAGDVIRVKDLVPVTSDLDAITLDALRTFYIVETDYNVESRKLKIVPDTEAIDLTSILAKEVKSRQGRNR